MHNFHSIYFFSVTAPPSQNIQSNISPIINYCLIHVSFKSFDLIYPWTFITVKNWKISYNFHCVIGVHIRSYSGPHFSAFGLNMERYCVSLRIQSECGKIRTGITRNTDSFFVVFLASYLSQEKLSRGSLSELL